ncbi:hypothetical protein EDD15DRAFT_2200735 [Pisolithus albus]|nr:hypothetical protein EDD15DRAFT_2200735 [Pisolithus albus]
MSRRRRMRPKTLMISSCTILLLTRTAYNRAICSREIWVTPSTLPEESTDDPRNKGKSKAEESEVASGGGDIDENSDLIQVIVSMDDVIITPPSTLQFSKERGYDVSPGNHVRVARGPAVGAEGRVRTVNFPSGRLTVLSEDSPWHDVPISFCAKVEDYSLRDQEYHVGRKVWIISGPSKGCRGMLRSGMLLSGIPLDSTRMAAFIALCQRLFPEIAPPPRRATPPPSLSAVDALAEPGQSCIPWLFDNDFCNYPRWHSCKSMVVHLLVISLVNQYCLVLWGELTGQIFWVKKCQSKKEPRGVELDDSTKLRFGDIYYVGLVVKIYMGDNILHSF